MSMERLQRLTDLDAQLKELDEERAKVLTAMHAIIGDGFVIAGARVKPIKTGKNALPKVRAREATAVTPEQFSMLSTPATTSDGKKENASNAERVLACLSGGGINGLTALTVSERTGLTVTQCANAITYLSQTGRIVKTAPGTYRAK